MTRYDTIYGDNIKYFGSRVILVDRILWEIKADWCLLDLGSWQWYMTLELAKWWFTNIIWVDSSQTWLNKFLELSQEKQINSQAVCCDITDFNFQWEYNCIIASLSLQFLKNQSIFNKIIYKIQNHTKNQWYVFISIPTHTKVAVNFNYMCQNLKELQDHFLGRTIIFSEEQESIFKNWNIWTVATILAQKT